MIDVEEAFNNLMRGLVIGLLIIVIAKAAHIERMLDSMAKAMQVEVAK